MSAGWQVGDLAVCVDDSPCHCGCRIPLNVGAVYTVTKVWPPLYGKIGLSLRGVRARSPHPAFDANRFRKIRPDEHESCEPEFVTLLNRIKRKVDA